MKSYSSDLLGLTTPINGSGVIEQKPVDNSNDVFGCFLSDTSSANGAINGKSVTAPSAQPKENVEQTLAQQEQDFFNQVPNEKEKAKMTKDSILALYGTPPTINRLPATNQFNIPQGMPMMNDNNSSTFGMQFQQPVFGMQNTGLNQQFCMMPQQTQSQPPTNFQQQMPQMPNQTMGFANIPQANAPPLQPFTQQTNANPMFPTTTSTVTNVNKQFGSLNLGNVWQ